MPLPFSHTWLVLIAIIGFKKKIKKKGVGALGTLIASPLRDLGVPGRTVAAERHWRPGGQT